MEERGDGGGGRRGEDRSAFLSHVNAHMMVYFSLQLCLPSKPTWWRSTESIGSLMLKSARRVEPFTPARQSCEPSVWVM